MVWANPYGGGGQRLENETPGHRIRQRRDQLGITQYELGRLVGLTEQAINKIEIGIMPVTMINDSYLPAIADALGTSVDYIMNGELHSERSTREEILRMREIGVIRSDQELKALDERVMRTPQRNEFDIPLSRAELLILLEIMRDTDGY